MKKFNFLDIAEYNVTEVDYLFDKVHEKYSVPNNENRVYHHYFYEIHTDDIEGEYFTLDELLELPGVRENNSDIISFIEEYYKNNSYTK